MCSVHEKFTATRLELSSALIEREEEIDCALVAMLAGENLLLVGNPGTAKSLLLDGLLSWLKGKKFSLLINKFTTPEEVFGPVSIKALKEDIYRRVTTNKLPEADVAFIDEVFKASTAILNTLLKILNERTYDVGDGTSIKVPLKLCVAASNEWPAPETHKELSALFDRFLIRKAVLPVRTAAGRERLLWNDDHTPKLSTTITAEELESARRHAGVLAYTDEAMDALTTVLRDLRKEGVIPGDRRQHKAVKLARAFAWLQGATQVEPEHLEVLSHVLWDDPQEQPQVVARTIARIANPSGMQISSLLLEAEEVLAATDVRNLTQAAAAAGKLQEITKKLAAVKASPRQASALAHVRTKVKEIKIASLEAY